MTANIQHRANPLHVYCRVCDLGRLMGLPIDLTRQIARSISRMWERIAFPLLYGR